MGVATWFHLLATAVTVYGIMIAVLYRRWDLEKRRPLRDASPPSVTVVLLAADGLPSPGPALEALSRQTYAARTQIVLVTPKGWEGTREALRGGTPITSVELGTGDAPRGRPITERQRAWDAGAAAADGDLLFLLEPGALPGPEWLQAMAAGFTPDVHGVAGHVRVDPDRDRDAPFPELQETDVLYLDGVSAGTTPRSAPAGIGINAGVRRTIWEAVGGMQGIGRALCEEQALFTEIRKGLGDGALRFRVGGGSTVTLAPARTLGEAVAVRRRWAAGAFKGGGMGAWLLGLTLLLALLFWGGVAMMPFFHSFAPIQAVGPYLGLYLVTWIYLDGAGHLSGYEPGRETYLPHMLVHLLYMALIGPLLMLPVRTGGFARQK